VSNPLALVIEDDYDSTVIFSEALQAASFDTIIAKSGDEGLEQLETIVPAVVVLDLHLPGVAGTSILEKIHSDPRLAETRVIVITGDVVLADSPLLQKETTVQILVKPVTYKRLRDLARLLKLSIERTRHE
jgi:CheY-like chemotaxis protein